MNPGRNLMFLSGFFFFRRIWCVTSPRPPDTCWLTRKAATLKEMFQFFCYFPYFINDLPATHI